MGLSLIYRSIFLNINKFLEIIVRVLIELFKKRLNCDGLSKFQVNSLARLRGQDVRQLSSQCSQAKGTGKFQ